MSGDHNMRGQCPSCGGDCGRTAKSGCQYNTPNPKFPEKFELCDSSELAERLRLGKGTSPDHKLLLEAASKIETLTAELAEEGRLHGLDMALVMRLTAERDALRAALQLIKANTNTLDWPDDINAAIQGAGK